MNNYKQIEGVNMLNIMMTKDTPLVLKTPSLSSEFSIYKDIKDDK